MSEDADCSQAPPREGCYLIPCPPIDLRARQLAPALSRAYLQSEHLLITPDSQAPACLEGDHPQIPGGVSH